jgi:hypothetical protein
MAKFFDVLAAQQRQARTAIKPTFARFPRFRGQDRSFDRLGQRQIVLSASKGRLKPAGDSTGTVKRPDLARSRHTFAVVACRI